MKSNIMFLIEAHKLMRLAPASFVKRFDQKDTAWSAVRKSFSTEVSLSPFLKIDFLK